MTVIGQAVKWFVFVFVPRWLILTLRSDIPRKLSENPQEHWDYQVGWDVRDSWSTVLEEHIAAYGHTMSDDLIASLRRIKINVAWVMRLDADRAIAFIRPSVELKNLPDAAFGLLLGVPASVARAVDHGLREAYEDLISPRHVMVYCHFRNGCWRPSVMQLEDMSPEAVVTQRLNEWDGTTLPSYQRTVESAGMSLPRRLVRRIVFDLILRRPPSTSGNPAWHTGEEIAASLLRKWDELVESHVDYVQYEKGESPELFKNTKLEVVAVLRRGNDTAAALVRTNMRRNELPILALTLLLGTRTDLAHDVDRIRRQNLSDEIPSDQVVVYCLFEDGGWNFVGTLDDERAIKQDTRVAIGEPIQLQTSWKEPPFAVTILGLPEVADQHTVRVPARITSILPRWSYSDIGGRFSAMLYAASGVDEDPIPWDNIGVDFRQYPDSLDEGHESNLVLVKGGSHEGFIYFQADSYRDQSVPDEPFVELHYLDETEQMLVVDLTRSRPVPERLRFADGRIGTLWDAPPVSGVEPRLASAGSSWRSEIVGTVPTAKIGDVVTADDWPDERGNDVRKPWYALTVLEPPTVFDESSLRLRLRITARDEITVDCRHMDFQLSSSPDSYGRLRHLWESERLWEVGPERPDSFADVKLEQGQTHEAFVYFSAPEGHDTSDVESLTLLWYGMRTFEMPIFLNDDRHVLT